MTSVYVLKSDRMKVGDTLPDLRVQLLEDGQPYNLDGYSVTFSLKRTDADSSKVSEASATVESVDRAIVTYDWSSGDTDTSGTYEIEFVADDGSGDEITFPNEGDERIYIQERL